MSKNSYIIQFYEINICQIMIFRNYTVYNKHKMIKIGNQIREKPQVLFQMLESFCCRLYNFNTTQNLDCLIVHCDCRTFVYCVEISTNEDCRCLKIVLSLRKVHEPWGSELSTYFWLFLIKNRLFLISFNQTHFVVIDTVKRENCGDH